MKKSSRLLSLALALVLALSLMALPAAAHEHDENDGIATHVEIMRCPECGKNATLQRDKYGNPLYFLCVCGWKDR